MGPSIARHVVVTIVVFNVTDCYYLGIYQTAVYLSMVHDVFVSRAANCLFDGYDVFRGGRMVVSPDRGDFRLGNIFCLGTDNELFLFYFEISTLFIGILVLVFRCLGFFLGELYAVRDLDLFAMGGLGGSDYGVGLVRFGGLASVLEPEN
jgi:hypothetical protein